MRNECVSVTRCWTSSAPREGSSGGLPITNDPAPIATSAIPVCGSTTAMAPVPASPRDPDASAIEAAPARTAASTAAIPRIGLTILHRHETTSSRRCSCRSRRDRRSFRDPAEHCAAQAGRSAGGLFSGTFRLAAQEGGRRRHGRRGARPCGQDGGGAREQPDAKHAGLPRRRLRTRAVLHADRTGEGRWRRRRARHPPRIHRRRVGRPEAGRHDAQRHEDVSARPSSASRGSAD